MTVVWYEAMMALPSYRQTVTRCSSWRRLQACSTRRATSSSAAASGGLSDGDLRTARPGFASWRGRHLLGPLFRFWHCWLIVWEALISGTWPARRATSRKFAPGLSGLWPWIR